MPTPQRHQPASCGRRRKTRNHRINCWATRWVPQAPTICQISVHPNYHPQNWTKNSGAGKSLISSRLFERLQQQREEFRHTREVAVNLFDISNRRLACQGTVTVDVLVEDERPREPFQQEFIVVPEIMEECVLGLDALYEHKFMIDGRERRVYRVRESDQLQNDDKPTMMVAVKTKIPPSSACVVESENSDVKLSLDTACFLVKTHGYPPVFDWTHSSLQNVTMGCSEL
ncbi:hypothetical protein OUZ56_018809 [Daphnia magna]|uniref:Uncharacterized protein n=1 Tax=Daphnia magna TaxID=35525 RepID=A0ABQ9ZA04_9CRUS|nr:hypothetical protein OUZ56_018809 [Daphnia magna]